MNQEQAGEGVGEDDKQVQTSEGGNEGRRQMICKLGREPQKKLFSSRVLHW